jgi:hypothetical protein
MAGSILGNLRASFSAAGGWPAERIVGALKRHFETVNPLGAEPGFKLYGVQDRGVNFVVALVEVDGVSDRVAEIAFLARFVGFRVDAAAVETINRNLHLSVAGLEDGGDLILLAGVTAVGAFDEAKFSLVLQAWRRDIILVLQVLTGRASAAAAFPAARSERARRFAANQAPTEASSEPDILSAYLDVNSVKALCPECGGRGKRGLIARTCECCDGSGFVKKG